MNERGIIMQAHKNYVLLHSVLFSFMISLAMLQSYAKAEEKQWIVLHDNISQEIKRINVALKFTQSDSTFYESSYHNIKSVAIEASGKEDAYKQKLDFGTAADGNIYSMLIRESKDLQIISHNSGRLCMAKIVRTDGKRKPVTIKEGYLFLQNEVEIPFEVSSKQLGISSEKPVPGTVEINISSNDQQSYEGNFNSSLKGALSGSTTIDGALLNASITCRNSLELKDKYLNLVIKPFNDQMAPASAKGNISDILTVGSAKIVVEKIASDSSELVFAILQGNLTQEPKPEKTLTVGKPFPDFARVELINRRLLTLGDLTKQAGPDGYVVLLFGNFKRAMSEPYHERRNETNGMPLDETIILEILKKDNEKPTVIAFVCQELSPSDMYEKWLGRNLDFYILSDFSNPLNVRFAAADMERYGFGNSPAGSETLRGQFAFANDKIIIALIDGRGDLVYINADAGKEMASSLVEINKLIKENKTSKNQE